MATIALTTTGVTFRPSNRHITAVYTDGTSAWVGTDNGEVHKFTLATGAYVEKLIQVSGKVLSFALSGTQLLIGTDEGKVYEYVLSTGACTEVELYLDSPVTAMSINSTTIVVCTADGKIRTYTIA
jgi:hypothetical protein